MIDFNKQTDKAQQDGSINVFLLYDGDSPDGRGDGHFVKATTNVKEAYRHYKGVKKNPYSTGSVWVLTNSSLDRICSERMEVLIFGKVVK